MFVVVALTQAVLLSALATTLVSLAPAAVAKSSCSTGPSGNPQGRLCGNPNDLPGGAPPAPACFHKNSQEL
jgi:hypothetical protein